MKPLYTFVLAAFLSQVAPMPRAMAQDVPRDAATVSLTEFQWLKRPVVVFADSPADPSFEAQLRQLAEDPAPLVERDVVVITDTDPAVQSELRRKLRPHGFALVIIDKDGEAKLRKPLPWSVREITRAIDKFPIRREELLEKYPAGR